MQCVLGFSLFDTQEAETEMSSLFQLPSSSLIRPQNILGTNEESTRQKNITFESLKNLQHFQQNKASVEEHFKNWINSMLWLIFLIISDTNYLKNNVF